MFYLDTSSLLNLGSLDYNTKVQILEYISNNKSDFTFVNTVQEEFTLNIDKFKIPDSVRNKNKILKALEENLLSSKILLSKLAEVINKEVVSKFTEKIEVYHCSIAEEYGEYKSTKIRENKEIIDKLKKVVFELKTQGLSYTEKIALLGEAELRYKHNVPPGYKDKSEDVKQLEFYNDYYIWKEIILDVKSKSITDEIYFVTSDLKDKKKDDIEKMRKEFFELTGNKIYIINTEDFLKKVNLGLIYQFLYEIKFLGDKINRLLEQNSFIQSTDNLTEYLRKCFEDENVDLLTIGYSGDLSFTTWEIEEINYKLNVRLESDVHTGDIEHNIITFLPNFDFNIKIKIACHSDYGEYFAGTIEVLGTLESYQEMGLDFTNVKERESLKSYLESQEKVELESINLEIFIDNITENIVRI